LTRPWLLAVLRVCRLCSTESCWVKWTTISVGRRTSWLGEGTHSAIGLRGGAWLQAARASAHSRTTGSLRFIRPLHKVAALIASVSEARPQPDGRVAPAVDIDGTVVTQLAAGGQRTRDDDVAILVQQVAHGEERLHAAA